MERSAFANATSQTKSGSPAMFACAAASAAASILIIRTLSSLLGVLLIIVLCGLLISLVLLHGRPADGNLR